MVPSYEMPCVSFVVGLKHRMGSKLSNTSPPFRGLYKTRSGTQFAFLLEDNKAAKGTKFPLWRGRRAEFPRLLCDVGQSGQARLRPERLGFAPQDVLASKTLEP